MQGLLRLRQKRRLGAGRGLERLEREQHRQLRIVTSGRGRGGQAPGLLRGGQLISRARRGVALDDGEHGECHDTGEHHRRAGQQPGAAARLAPEVVLTQPADVLHPPDRTVDDGADALDELDVDPHPEDRGHDVREHHRGVDVVSAHRLERHLGA